MKQTKKHSKGLRLLSAVLALVMALSLLPLSVFAEERTQDSPEEIATNSASSEFIRIFHLDCGRKYFSVAEIEGIIDQLAENHFTHIQLAFGNNGFRFLLDNMSVTANGTTYSSEEVTSAITSGNRTYSSEKNTASTMLSQDDMDTIIAYAKKKNISVIPMLNTPGHMDALVSAMKTLGIRSSTGSEMSITSESELAFIKALQQKYITYFADNGSERYNFAADEYSFSGLTNTQYTAFAQYVNDLAAMVKEAKMIPMAYNDGINYSGKTTTVPFDTDIQICYWSQAENYASVTDLAKDFKIINNNDAWYYVLGDYLHEIWAKGQWGYEDAKKGLQNTPVTQAKNADDKAIDLVGSVLCCWCDGPSKSWSDSKAKVYDLIKTMADANPDYFKAAPVVGIDADKDNVYVGDTVTLSVSNGAEATWTVAPGGILTLTETSGASVTATATAAGTATVTATVDGVAYTKEIKVIEIAISTATEVLVLNGSVELTINSGASAVWTTSDDSVVQLQSPQNDESGNVIGNSVIARAVGVGAAMVKAVIDGKEYTIELTVTNRTLTQKEVRVAVGATKTVTIDGVNYAGEEYTLANPNIATVENVTGTDAAESTEKYTSSSVSYATLAGSNTSWTKTDYYYYDGSNYYPVYAYYTSGYYYNKYYYGYSETDSANSVEQINYSWLSSDKVTVYTKTGTPATAASTTITIKGVAEGTTTLMIGDYLYTIYVSEPKTIEIPITIVDYRADGLLFDWTYNPDSGYADSYRYGFVHSNATSWGIAVGYGVAATYNSTTGLYEVNGATASYIDRIAGTTIQRTGSANNSTTFYPHGTDNDWSRAGLVENTLGANGMPVYTDAVVQYVAGLLNSGYYNKMDGNCNSIIYDTFVSASGDRTIRNTSTSAFSSQFELTKAYDDISTAYDLAWYLLSTFYQADTNMTTVTGTDGAEHEVPIYGMGVDAYKSIVLTDNGDGTYSFEAGYSDNPKSVVYDRTNGTISNGTTDTSIGFYPINGLGYEQDNLLTETSKISSDNNGNFTLRGESQFVYEKNSNLYFTFTGDDDVYMFINGKLALDLGGAHGRNTKTVYLNDLDSSYGLVDGETANFVFFYMERCSDASTFGIETNMQLVEHEIDVEKNAYSDSNCTVEIPNGSVVNNGNTFYYDLVVTNKGNTSMTNFALEDTDTFNGSATLGYDKTAAVNPGAPNADGSVISLGNRGSYSYFVTDSTGTLVGTTATCASMDELSSAVASVTLYGGQSLHIRFLNATVNVAASKIASYTNTVKITASSGGTRLSDSASHEIYAYNANDTTKTYVVDFGLPLKVDGIFDEGAKGYFDNTSTVKLTNTPKYGEVSEFTPAGFDTSFVYTLKTFMDNMEVIELSVPYSFGEIKRTLTKRVNIIPASNVYYEDSFAHFENGAGAAAAATWGKVGTEKTGVYQALEELGGRKNVYGYDKAYDDCTTFSMGSAHTVNVTSDMAANWNSYADSAWPTATFTFKGTGFDIISLTDNTSGAIFVDVVKTATGTAVKNLLVDNYYGYKQEGNTWVVDPTASDTLYQIPVMKVTGLDYDEYTVTIKVAYSSYFDHTANKTNYNFWLDAIRVYDPMGENAEYTKDGEGYPQYIKLRDAIAKDGTAEVKTALFIDGAENADITTYANYGPNNEVYLAKGQAITFNVQGENIASVQIGAKAPKGTAKMSVGGTETSIGTATEMYYTISNAGGQFTITNTGDSILSLTNLKITFTQNSTASLAALTTQEQNDAVMAVRALFTVAPEPFEPSRFEPSWNRTTVRAGQKATLIVKTSEDVDAITVNGQTITTFRVRTERTGWGWWSSKVTYREFTYSVTPTETTDYAVAAVNAEGVASEPQTFRLTVSNRGFGGWLKDLFRF